MKTTHHPLQTNLIEQVSLKMSDQNGVAAPTVGEQVKHEEEVLESKGKGKAATAPTQDLSMEGMDEDEDESDEETGAEDEVDSNAPLLVYVRKGDCLTFVCCLGSRRGRYVLSHRMHTNGSRY